MNKDRIVGAGKQFKGDVKEKVGKAVGDKKMEAEGKLKKTEGKAQNIAGGIEDAARETADAAERADK